MKRISTYFIMILIIILGIIIVFYWCSEKKRKYTNFEKSFPLPTSLPVNKYLSVKIKVIQDTFACYFCIDIKNLSNQKLYVPYLNSLNDCIFISEKGSGKSIKMVNDWVDYLSFEALYNKKRHELGCSGDCMSRIFFSKHAIDSLQKALLALFPTEAKRQFEAEGKTRFLMDYAEGLFENEIILIEPYSTCQRFFVMQMSQLNCRAFDIYYNYPGRILDTISFPKEYKLFINNVKYLPEINGYKYHSCKISSDTLHVNIQASSWAIKRKEKEIYSKYR